VVIPARAMRELARILCDRVLHGDQQLSLQVMPNRVIFRWPGMTLSALILEGKFPDYEKIIPLEHKTRTTVLTADFRQACRQAGIFAREGSSVARLEISPVDEQGGSRITIRGVSEETGSNQTLIQAGVQGEALQAGYNVHFLQDALSVIKSPTMILETADPTSPGVIRPAEGDDFLQILMPMHLGGGE
jgi:DNA polymerase III subunit beta